jgi:hypothetical protein
LRRNAAQSTNGRTARFASHPVRQMQAALNKEGLNVPAVPTADGGRKPAMLCKPLSRRKGSRATTSEQTLAARKSAGASRKSAALERQRLIGHFKAACHCVEWMGRSTQTTAPRQRHDATSVSWFPTGADLKPCACICGALAYRASHNPNRKNWRRTTFLPQESGHGAAVRAAFHGTRRCGWRSP